MNLSQSYVSVWPFFPGKYICDGNASSQSGGSRYPGKSTTTSASGSDSWFNLKCHLKTARKSWNILLKRKNIYTPTSWETLFQIPLCKPPCCNFHGKSSWVLEQFLQCYWACAYSCYYCQLFWLTTKILSVQCSVWTIWLF